MGTNQSGRHEGARAIGGTSADYNGDFLAMFAAHGFSTGTFNSRFLNWLNYQLGATYTSLPGAMHAYAVACGFRNWESANTIVDLQASGADTDVRSLVARMTVAPEEWHRSAISQLVHDLSASGVWAKLDVLQVFAMHAEQAALLNWKGTGFTPAAVSSPTFTAFRGYAGNGSSSYINTNWSPSSGARNSISWGVWYNTGATTTNAGKSGTWNTSTGHAAMNVGVTSSGWISTTWQVYANTAYDGGYFQPAVVPYFANGLQSITRSSSTNVTLYAYGNVVASTSSLSSAGASQHPYLLGALNYGGSTLDGFFDATPVAAFFATSAALSDAETASFSGSLTQYMSAVGNYSLDAVGWGDSLSSGTWQQRIGPVSVANGKPFRRAYAQGIAGNTSAQIATRMLADTTYQSAIQVIWAGRNDINNAAQTVASSTIKSNIASMVAAAKARSNKWVVVGVTTRNSATGSIYSNSENAGTTIGNAVAALNSDLAGLYGSNFVDMLYLMCAQGTINGGSDAADAALSVPPRSFMSDDIHFNAAGDLFVANCIEAKIEALGY